MPVHPRRSGSAPVAPIIGGVVVLMLVLGASSARAAGFQVFEVGVIGQGTAHAGMTTRADGAETVHFNPAGMALLSGSQLSFGLSRHFVDAEFSGRGEYGPAAGPLEGIGFENGARGADGGDTTAPAPGLYAVFDIASDVRFGLGVNTQFGLGTDYGETWSGRYLAARSALDTVNINPSFAVRLNDELALAAGVNAVYADAKLSQALDLGLLLAAVGEAPGLLSNDGRGVVEGDDWGYGLNVGLIFEPVAGTRVGVSYRSAQKIDLEGTAAFVPGRYPAASFGPLAAPVTAASEIDLPAWASIGVYREVTSRWAVMLDVTWTDWSVVDELRIRFPDSSLRADTVLPTNWEDSWRFSAGGALRISPAWTLRFGAAREETPVPDPFNYSPRVPAGNGLSLSVGASVELSSRIGVDFAYTHIDVDALPIDRTVAAHRIVGDYDGSVDVVGAQLRYGLE